MSRALAFAVFSIFLISACVNVSDTTKAGISFVEKKSDDILVRAELSQADLKSGLPVNLKFTAENKQQFDLKNFQLNVYDLCDFDCGNAPTEWNESTIRVNRTKDFILNCKAPTVDLERTCGIKFQATYEGSAFQTHDVFVITESEFATGKTKVSPIDTETKSPLKVSVSWSDPQPFVENDQAIMYLDYEYSGDGIIEKLREKTSEADGDVSFTFPRNLIIDESKCIDFSKLSDNNYTLSKDLTFIAGKAKRSTCVFKTKASQPIDSGKIYLSAKFGYKLDGSVPVKILPRKTS